MVPLMAILVQEQISPAYSFVLHTKDPFSSAADSGMYAELAVGLGETLASANQPGVPYKLAAYDSDVNMKGFANYSKALVSSNSADA